MSKSQAVKAAQIKGATDHGRKMGLAKRGELKRDATARQELAADYYRRSKDEGEYDPAERAYYLAFADALMGVKTTEVVPAVKAKRQDQSQKPFDKVRAWRKFFATRVFTTPFAFGFAGGGGDDVASGAGNDAHEGATRGGNGANKSPSMPPVVTYVVAFFIGTIAGAVVSGDVGVGLVLGGAATREVYARKSSSAYNPWVARAVGILPSALTLMGTMWQFGLALVLNLWLWQYVPLLYQEPSSGEDSSKDDMPSSM